MHSRSSSQRNCRSQGQVAELSEPRLLELSLSLSLLAVPRGAGSNGHLLYRMPRSVYGNFLSWEWSLLGANTNDCSSMRIVLICSAFIFPKTIRSGITCTQHVL